MSGLLDLLLAEGAAGGGVITGEFGLGVPVAYVNDQDVGDVGFTVRGLEGWSSGIQLTVPALAVPGMLGQLPIGAVTAEARTIQLDGYITCTTVAERDAALRAVLAILRGRLELRFADKATRVIDAVMVGAPVVADVPEFSWVDPDLILTAQLVCHDPTFRDRYASAYAFGATAVAVACGDLPSRGLMRIMGPATNPAVAHADFRGQAVGSGGMGFTATLTSSEYLEIDHARQTIARVTSGVRSVTDTLDLWTSGDFFAVEDDDRISTSAGTGILYLTGRYRT